MTTITESTTEGIASMPERAESQKFASDVIWFGVAQLFVSLILGVVTLPVLTKSYAPAVYGIWVQVNATVSVVSPVLSMQLGLAAVRFLAGEESREERRRSLGAMLSAITIVVLAASAAGAVFSRQLSSFLFNSPAYANYVYFLVTWVTFNALFNFFLSYLRSRSRIREISIIQIVLTTLQMTGILILATRASALDMILAVMVGLQIVFGLSTLAMITREIGFPRPNLSGLRTFLAYGLPQTPVIVLLWAISLSDRYFVTHFLGLSETAIYSSSALIAGLISLFYVPISFVLLPQMSRLSTQKRPAELKGYFDSSIRLFLTLAIPAAIGIAMVSQPLLRILTTSHFLAGREIVFVLALGVMFLGVYQMNANLILLDRRAKWLPVITGSAYATSIVMNILLVPRIGIAGAAISDCTSYFVVAAITAVWAKKIINYSLNIRYLGKVAASAAAMMLSLTFIEVDSGWTMVLAVVVGGSVFAAGLVVSKAFTRADGQVIGKTLSGVLRRRQV